MDILPDSFRGRFRLGIYTAGAIHFIMYLAISRTYEWRGEILGVMALLMAAGLFLLAVTKPTLEDEQTNAIIRAYKLGYWCWGATGILFLLGFFDKTY